MPTSSLRCPIDGTRVDECHNASLGVTSTAGQPPPRARRPPSPASTGSRLAAVVIDFIVLKVLCWMVVAVIAGVAILLLAGGKVGEEQAAKTNTVIALSLSAAVSFWYFVLSPGGRNGQTIGQRIAGIRPRSVDDQPAPMRSVRRHSFIVFFVPSLLLNPITPGPRDLLVVMAWCGVQLLRNDLGQTPFEKSADIRFSSELP